MKPVLFWLGEAGRGLPVSGYGLAVAIGFAVGIVLAVREGRRLGFDASALVDLSFWILVVGIAGSRLLHVLLEAGAYGRLCAGGAVPGGGAARSMGRVLADCAAPLAIWRGGLVFHGGALAAAGAAALFARRRGWSFGRVADAFAPGLAIGHAIGRLGCFLAGCCYGQPTALPWGARFPRGSVAFAELARAGAVAPGAPATAALHPTQLYEALGELTIFAVLLATRRRSRFAGQTALVYALLYAALRSVVEPLRADGSRVVIALGVAVAAVAAGGLVAGLKRSRSNR